MPESAHDLTGRFLNHPEEFVSVKDAASTLRKSESAIRQMLPEGKVRAAKVGGTIWIWLPSLRVLIREYE